MTGAGDERLAVESARAWIADADARQLDPRAVRQSPYEMDRTRSLLAAYDTCARQRDEARAEIARLRALAGRLEQKE